MYSDLDEVMRVGPSSWIGAILKRDVRELALALYQPYEDTTRRWEESPHQNLVILISW